MIISRAGYAPMEITHPWTEAIFMKAYGWQDELFGVRVDTYSHDGEFYLEALWGLIERVKKI